MTLSEAAPLLNGKCHRILLLKGFAEIEWEKWMSNVGLRRRRREELRQVSVTAQQRIMARSLSNKNVNWSESSQQVSPRWQLRQLVTVQECQAGYLSDCQYLTQQKPTNESIYVSTCYTM